MKKIKSGQKTEAVWMRAVIMADGKGQNCGACGGKDKHRATEQIDCKG